MSIIEWLVKPCGITLTVSTSILHHDASFLWVSLVSRICTMEHALAQLFAVQALRGIMCGTRRRELVAYSQEKGFGTSGISTFLQLLFKRRPKAQNT